MKPSRGVRNAVAIYAGLFALADLVILLPDDRTSFSTGWGVVGSVLIQALVVWRLVRGSALAWAFGLFMALATVAAFFLMAASFDVAVTLIVVACLAQAGVLLTPPLRGLVWRSTPPASA